LKRARASSLENRSARIVEKLNRLHHEIENLVSRQLKVGATSPYADRPLGDTRARTGASIVAIVRDDRVENGPAPSAILHVGDRLVTIGTEQSVGQGRPNPARTRVAHAPPR
jgi:TrkA domain protein